jgi:hypothetical protein
LAKSGKKYSPKREKGKRNRRGWGNHTDIKKIAYGAGQENGSKKREQKKKIGGASTRTSKK